MTGSLLLALFALLACHSLAASPRPLHHHPSSLATRVAANSTSVMKTVLAWTRAVRTCDLAGDTDVPTGTSRIIYAASESDPVSELKVPFHSLAYGVKNVALFDAPVEPAPLPRGDNASFVLSVMTRPFLVDRSSESSPATYYHCQGFQFNLTQKSHVVKVVPQIDFKHAAYLHHMLLFVCPTAFTEQELQWQGTCYGKDNARPQKINSCDQINVLAGWAVGGNEYSYPLDVGYPVGQNGLLSLMLQVHYHNPQGDSFVDSAGFQLMATTNLRPREAMSLVLHQNLADIIIPAQTAATNISVMLPADCTSRLPEKGLSVFATMLHTHVLGVAVQIEHLSTASGLVVEKPMLDYNPSYDFNFQQLNSFAPGKYPVIQAGDALKLTCTYNSIGRPTVTRGGIATTDEMCHAYAWYYLNAAPPTSPTSFAQAPLIDVMGLTRTPYKLGQNYSSSCVTDTAVVRVNAAEPRIQVPLPTRACVVNTLGNRTYGSAAFPNGSANSHSLTPVQWLMEWRPRYPRSMALDDHGRFVLYWRIEPSEKGETLLHMALETATDGWAGLAFSPSGSMLDADSVIGWVIAPWESIIPTNDSVVDLTDRFNREYAMPLPDVSQDVFNVYGLQTMLDLVVPPPSPIYYNVYASSSSSSSSAVPPSASSSSSSPRRRRPSSSTAAASSTGLRSSSSGSPASSSSAMPSSSSSDFPSSSSSNYFPSTAETSSDYQGSSSSTGSDNIITDDSSSSSPVMFSILLLVASIVVCVAIIAYMGKQRGWFIPSRTNNQLLSVADTSYTAL